MEEAELTREQVLEALRLAYESAVVIAAKENGGNPRHFGEAACMLPPEKFDAMRDAYRRQIEDLS